MLTGLKSTFADGYFAAAPETGAPPDVIAGDDRIFGESLPMGKPSANQQRAVNESNWRIAA